MIALIVSLFIFIFTISLFVLFKTVDSQFKYEKSSKKGSSVSALSLEKRPSVSDVSEIHKDIYLEAYGCFSSLEKKFFATVIRDDKYDSGVILKNNEDIKRLVEKIINDGYDIFGNRILRKYNNNYDNINIIELGILGKLSGHNYISVFSYDENRRGNVYLTYSPPMDRQVTYDDPNFDQYLSKSDAPELSLINKNDTKLCGYPCKGDSNGFMCGSIGFPEMKSPTRFAVYRITER
jgi:hypothetical protein